MKIFDSGPIWAENYPDFRPFSILFHCFSIKPIIFLILIKKILNYVAFIQETHSINEYV